MKKTTKTVSALHGITFTLFFIIDTILTYFLYPALNAKLGSAFLEILISTIVSAFLYSVLYFIVSSVYKLAVFYIKDRKLKLGGVWYHVHIKRNIKGFIPTDKLRAGETHIKQNFYDLTFTADNRYFSLDENGEIKEDKNQTHQTHWEHATCSWDGESKIIACYKADSSNKNAIKICPFCNEPFKDGAEITTEKKERLGIHNLTLINQNVIKGTFADEYPSASYGEIFFFRKKEERDALIKDFLQDGDIDN
nr:hypothetical protein [Clostridia bacterium]